MIRCGDRGYVGGLRPDQIEFVRNYLKLVSRDDLIVLTMHIPLVQHERFRESDQKELFSLLVNFLILSLYLPIHIPKIILFFVKNLLIGKLRVHIIILMLEQPQEIGGMD